MVAVPWWGWLIIASVATVLLAAIVLVTIAVRAAGRVEKHVVDSFRSMDDQLNLGPRRRAAPSYFEPVRRFDPDDRKPLF